MRKVLVVIFALALVPASGLACNTGDGCAKKKPAKAAAKKSSKPKSTAKPCYGNNCAQAECGNGSNCAQATANKCSSGEGCVK